MTKQDAAQVDERKPTDTTKLPDDNRSPIEKLQIWQALLATTWRIAVPVLIFAGIGIYSDLKLGSKPWLTIAGSVIGFVIAGLLIARLIKESETL